MTDPASAFFAEDADELSPRALPGETIDLVELDQDHPGFRDPAYRARRNEIARIAMAYRDGDPLPEVPYSDEEHGVWRDVFARLLPLHRRRAAHELAAMHEVLPLPTDRIPTFAEVNEGLRGITGYTLRPVAGLVSLRTFLGRLGKRQFLSTQYIRHASRPLYTPEPDVIHEVLGHAVSLAHPGLALVNELLGWAAEFADDREIQRLGQVYWYTLEFGACVQNGQVKAVGAGLLSSCGELDDFDRRGELRPWDLDVIAETPFDPTTYQPFYFVAPSLDAMLADLADWVMQGEWKAPVRAQVRLPEG